MGLAGDSYYSLFVHDETFESIFSQYRSLFFTTRNGLFFGVPSVMIGYYIATRDLNGYKTRNLWMGVCGFAILLNLEAFIIKYYGLALDNNMYVSSMFLVYFLFLLLLKHPSWNVKWVPKYDYSLGIYLVHGIFVMVAVKIFKLMGLSTAAYSTLVFIMVAIASQNSVYIFNRLRNMQTFPSIIGVHIRFRDFLKP
jgi:membrane-bound acyltransferase YfiQ involved in biofilm formation